MEIKVVKDFQLVEVEKLVPYINNARTHSPAQINTPGNVFLHC